MKKRRLFIAASSLLVSLLMLFALAGAVAADDDAKAKSENTKGDAVLAKIASKTITEAGLKAEMEEVAKEFRMRSVKDLPEDKQDEFRKMVLHRMVEKEIIMEKSKEMGDEDLDIQIDTEIKKIVERFPDEKTFKASLEQQGKTMDELKAKIREGLAVRKVMDKITESTPGPSDEEIKKYYDEQPERFQKKEEVKASHILVKVEKNASDEEKAAAKKKIEELAARIKAGEDFGKLASENSDCPSGKRAQGDLGWFGHGRMVPEFDKAAFKLKKGEVSDVIETSFGYHVIKLTDRHEERVEPLEEVKDTLKEELSMRAKGKEFMIWLQNQKDKKASFTNKDDAQIEYPQM